MELLTTLFSVSLGAILVNNFIFAQFLGICPFMGVSKKVDTALGMAWPLSLSWAWPPPCAGQSIITF